MAAPPIELTYTTAFDPALYIFTDPALQLRVSQTVDVMKLMLCQPNKLKAAKATTSIMDSATGVLYNIKFVLA